MPFRLRTLNRSLGLSHPDLDNINTNCQKQFMNIKRFVQNRYRQGHGHTSDRRSNAVHQNRRLVFIFFVMKVVKTISLADFALKKTIRLLTSRQNTGEVK